MRSERIARKERYVRGAPPKVSLVLTGIESFGALILAIILFVLGSRVGSGAMSLFDLGSSDSSDISGLVDMFSAGLGSFASAFMMAIAVIVLVYAIWCLIFWLICMGSKYRRRRMIVCTVLGRLFGLILILMYLSVESFGPLFLLIFVWVFLNILLSAVGWHDNPAIKSRYGEWS
ncbi:MAG: hypothetical protein LIO56_01535 [Lachnospiraceae bacterium]|nr:hypothetical protein [Lachnospiraceae bacterium]